MDDQFLHQLRRDPPAGFAIRLKWQLDRPVPTRPSRARLLLVFAIFGTAFALVSPQARRTFGDLFHNVAGSPQIMTPASGGRPVPRAPSTPALSGIHGPSGAPLSRSAAARPVSSAQGPLPAEKPQSPQSVDPDAQPIDGAAMRSRLVVAPNSILTPQMRAAEAAVLTRRGLFRVLSLVTLPLGSMLEGRTPVDIRIARISAYRLNRLSSMIPEVFQNDTRAFDTDTRALNDIWSQGEDFRSKVEALTLAADELDMTTATGDEEATVKAIGRMEKACNACHLVYRRN
jgi:cytochrome c556